MLTSAHHITLEEIGRLERERDSLNERIKALRATLPREDKPSRASNGLSPAQAAPVQTMLTVNPHLPEKKPEPVITDHAVLRYLERKHGFDFETTRRSLLSPAVRLAVEIGAKTVKADGGKLVIVGHKIVTFNPKGNPRKVYSGKPKQNYRDGFEDEE